MIEVEHDGKTYRAEFDLVDNILTVHGDTRSESTQLGGLPAIKVAHFLLRNLIGRGDVQPVEE
ncbi:hypothetical protein [Stenotrophomonas rhizophila]|uniref:hypothetical protein n=1 Tax=Stenotrophomonas rhizophila TaxID=216778 RepID=UPI001E5335C3|nr:hypothetical protein [Stenotrophomonas rhizophila]MCC7633842.1 hypothetical protein [Stenotrophomonas rhizophila]MCC7665388.1 hypothetical protein [Stenotrophomonas rhizophila]